MLLFKAVGLILIFSACAFGGFMKAEQLQKRTNRLKRAVLSVSKLAEYIRADGGEISRLIPLCFGDDAVFTENGRPQINEAYLLKEDTELLNEFFGELGVKDRQSEYERTVLYTSLIEKQYTEALHKGKELGRLYGTLGLICGVFLIIFFI